MTARVTDPEVREIIETDASVSLEPFIATATALTDWLDSKDEDGVLNDALLTQIEKYLAAHFYEANRDKQLQSKSTGRASGQYQGQAGMKLESTDPGQTALTLDVTGNLASLQKRRVRGKVLWAGKAADSLRPDEN